MSLQSFVLSRQLVVSSLRAIAKQSSVSKDKVRWIAASLALLAMTWGGNAHATPPSLGLGTNHIVAKSAVEKLNAGKKLSPIEEMFLSDNKEYNAINTKLWPICQVGGSSDVAQDCKNLKEEELKGSFLEAKGSNGLQFRYRVNTQEMIALAARKSELEKKWSTQVIDPATNAAEAPVNAKGKK